MRYLSIFLPGLVAVSLAGCADGIDKTITEGSYKGYVIGAPAESVYARIQKARGNIGYHGLSLVHLRRMHTLDQLSEMRLHWQEWDVYIPRDSLRRLLIIRFDVDTVTGVHESEKGWGPWNPGTPATNRVLIAPGITMDSAYRALRVAEADSAFQDMRVKVGFAPWGLNLLRPYAPFLTDTAYYEPWIKVRRTDEPRAGRNTVGWYLPDLQETVSGGMTFYFTDGKLEWLHHTRREAWGI